MTRPIPVIFNPAARSTKAARRERCIRRLNPAPEMHLTEKPTDATDIAFRLATEGSDIVVAAGGDGTMNEVLQGVCRANALKPPGQPHTALGVLPVGTMNVFALELGLPGKNIQACWQRIVSGKRQEIDLWMANDSYFVQLAGIGVDAEIVKATTWEMKKKWGPLSYVISTLRVLREKPATLTVEMEGRPPVHGTLVLTGSGRHYGGPFRVFPEALNNDGLLDVLVFHRVGWSALFQVLATAIRGRPSGQDGLECFRVPGFKIKSDCDTPMELDGELSGATPAEFKRAVFPLTVAV